jgi:hypothetical protein
LAANAQAVDTAEATAPVKTPRTKLATIGQKREFSAYLQYRRKNEISVELKTRGLHVKKNSRLLQCGRLFVRLLLL